MSYFPESVLGRPWRVLGPFINVESFRMKQQIPLIKLGLWSVAGSDKMIKTPKELGLHGWPVKN